MFAKPFLGFMHRPFVGFDLQTEVNDVARCGFDAEAIEPQEKPS
jgi:hypothetical protein